MTNELKHYGVKGMRWGIRRYQNPDGTRTAAGKKRYRDKPSFLKTKKKTNKQKELTNDTKKRISEMSDEELDYAIRRKQKEKTLMELMGNPQVQAKGQSKVKQALKETGMRLLKDAAYKIGMDKVEKVLKSKDPDVKLERMAKKLKYKTDTHNLNKSQHDFERSKTREPFNDEREAFNLKRDKFNLEKDQYNFERKKAENAREDWKEQHFYYQPKPTNTYPMLPGPTTSSTSSSKKSKNYTIKRKKKK